MFQNVLYDFPQAAYLLLAVPFLIGLFWSLYHYRAKILEPFFKNTQILLPRRGIAYWGQSFFLCLAWIFGVIALMQPKGNEHYPVIAPESPQKKEIRRRTVHDVIFLLDASDSMSVKDTRSGISRLDEAKNIVNEIVRKLKGEYGSLYAFTSDAMQMSPSTLDYLFLRLMLRQIQINEGETSGTDIGQSLSKIRQEYFAEPSPRLKTLILLSDGGDTRLEALTGQTRDQAIASITHLLDNAESHHLRVFTVGLGGRERREIPGLSYQGKPVLTQLEEDILMKLSAKGRGRYYFANDYSPMQIAADIVAMMSQDDPFTEEEAADFQQGYLVPIYDKYFQWPLGIALASLLLAILIPETLKTRESS